MFLQINILMQVFIEKLHASHFLFQNLRDVFLSEARFKQQIVAQDQAKQYFLRNYTKIMYEFCQYVRFIVFVESDKSYQMDDCQVIILFGDFLSQTISREQFEAKIDKQRQKLKRKANRYSKHQRISLDAHCKQSVNQLKDKRLTNSQYLDADRNQNLYFGQEV